MSDSEKSKRVGEVSGFIELFRSLQKSLFGLLLLEIGWVLLLVLVTQLSTSPKSENARSQITLPTIRFDRSWSVVHFKRYDVIDVAVPGGVVVLILWLAVAGHLFYPWQ